MKNFKFQTALLLGLLFVGHTYAKTVSYNLCEESNGVIPIVAVLDDPGKDYDFSYLKPGETTDITGYDSNGKPFKYRVTRTSNGIDVAVYSNSIKDTDPNTAITFRGPKGVVSSTTLGEVSSQRCGWICVIAHVFCVKIHVGPPGNTWEWDCDTSTNEN
jgi:hypothetical protein